MISLIAQYMIGSLLFESQFKRNYIRKRFRECFYMVLTLLKTRCRNIQRGPVGYNVKRELYGFIKQQFDLFMDAQLERSDQRNYIVLTKNWRGLALP